MFSYVKYLLFSQLSLFTLISSNDTFQFVFGIFNPLHHCLEVQNVSKCLFLSLYLVYDLMFKMRFSADHPVLVWWGFISVWVFTKSITGCNEMYYNVLHYTAWPVIVWVMDGVMNACLAACLQTQAYLSLIHGVLTMLIQWTNTI